MILISFDPSSKSTGYAVFEDENLIDYGCFEENSKNILERISNIWDKARDLIKKYCPDEMVIENVQITMSAPTAKALLGLQLILEVEAYRNNIPYTTIRPTSWRKTLGLSNSPKIKRPKKKKQAIEYVENKYNIEIKKDDVADAICIGTACLIKEEKK